MYSFSQQKSHSAQPRQTFSAARSKMAAGFSSVRFGGRATLSYSSRIAAADSVSVLRRAASPCALSSMARCRPRKYFRGMSRNSSAAAIDSYSSTSPACALIGSAKHSMLKRNHSAEPTRLPRHVTLTRIAAKAYDAACAKPPSPAVRSIARPMHSAAGTDTAPLRSKAVSSTTSSDAIRPGAKPFAV